MAFEGGADTGVDVGGVDELLGGASGGGAATGDGGAAAGADGGAGGDAGAGAVEGEGGGAGTTPDWFERVSATAGEGETSSNRDWLAAKGVKDIDGLVKSYRVAEKSLRDGGRVKVPGEGAKPEEIAAWNKAIGVPEAVEGYEVKGPEGVPLNEPLIGALRESALKHGAPKGAFEGLVSDFIKLQMDEAAAETKRQDDLAQAWLKDQGAKADEQRAHVNTAARSLGLTKTDMAGLRSGLGADRALGLLAKLGAGMAEDVLMTCGSNRFGVTGAEAQAEIDRLKTDADFQSKNKPGTPERTRWDRLNRQAAEYKAAQDG